MDVNDEWVNFLGYRVHRHANDRIALDISKKAMSCIHETIRTQTPQTFLSLEELISELNEYARGACEYFRLAEARTLWTLDRFVLARIARWSRHKRVRRLPEWSLARGTYLYRERGLVTWWRRKQPTAAPA